MKISCVVILYHPGEETYTNILTYHQQVEKLFVFDNSYEVSALDDQLRSLHHVEYHHDGQNEGIAKRLNTAAFKAIEEGYDWLLMMDQDSSFPGNSINNYFNCISQIENKSSIALIGPNHDYEVRTDSYSCEAVPSDELITSGTLLNLSLFSNIGPFDENLFIDGVDHEYIIRTLISGYHILQFKNIYLKHNIGATSLRASIKTLFLIRKRKSLHPPIRLYYIYRNNLYLQRKYQDHQTEVLQKIDESVKVIIWRNLHYGKNLFKQLRYLYKARKDLRNNRMGKYRGKL